jgi:hypothetical protein
MPYTLNATACPVPPVFSGVYDVTTGPLTSKSFAANATTAIRPNLNENGGRQDMQSRYGGGGYAIATGLAISAGSGLTLNIAAGHAQIDGVVPVAAISVTLTDAGRNWIWCSRAGAITVVFNSLTPPAGAYCLLGSALTSGGSISSVDQSGVLYLIGGTLWRKTADTTTPGDTPPASLQFIHEGGSSKVWWWTGTQYVDISSLSLPVSIANGGTGKTTAVDAVDNLGGAHESRLTKAVAASFTFTAAEVNAASEIDMTAGGVAARFTATFPTTAHTIGDSTSGIVPGHVFVLKNNTGYSCIFKANGGSDRFLGTGHWVICCYDGTEIQQVAQGGTGAGFWRYGAPVATAPTQTYSFWDEVAADHLEFSPSGGNVTVVYPATLSQRGHRQTVKCDHTTSSLTLNGTKFLPGEFIGLVMDGAGAMQRENMRPYRARGGVSMTSDADKTVAHPDFLPVFLEVTSSISLTATRNLVLPTVDDHDWYVLNSTTGGQSLVVKTSGGAGIRVPNGKGLWLRGNGTDIVRADALKLINGGSEEVAATTTSTATVQNSTSEGTLLGTVIGSATLPASVLQPGRTVRVRVMGVLSTAAAPGTLNLKLKFGSTQIVATGAQTPTGSLTTRLFQIDVLITCRTTGGSGTVFAQGAFRYMPAATGNETVWEMASTATVTIDTTASQAVDVTATWNTADASNIISGTDTTIELLN